MWQQTYDGAGPLRLAVIVASTREGRIGDRIGRWFAGRAATSAHLAPTVLDLADYDFPARYPATPTGPVAAFTAELAAADAFVVVTPEYNHSYPASLKQAIDYGYDEWQAKPAGFVAYGCETGGRLAVEHLRAVFAELHVVTMRNIVTLNVLDGTDATGDPVETDALRRAATVLCDQLAWWGRALRSARTAEPYVS